MRLIDADKLIQCLLNDPLFESIEQFGITGVINAQPTVDAIPVEWIQRKIDMLEQNIDSDLPKPAMLAQLTELVNLKRLVIDWEIEKENGEINDID